jgi:alpha-beta hydrolase superfamily lysophospholipase
MNRHKNIYTLFLVLMTAVLPVQASDIAREKRWADQIVDFLAGGEPQWLEVDGRQFFSIYTPAVTNSSGGAVILLHGIGEQPDWPQVIQPLRTQLPKKNWATLSLQVPVLGNDIEQEEYVPLFKEVPARIKAGLDFLSQKGINNIVLVGHSLGTSIASNYLVEHSDPRIKAFVGIGIYGMPQPTWYRALDNTQTLIKINIPVLDIYGSQSIKPILNSVDRRAYVVSHLGDHRSRQIEI